MRLKTPQYMRLKDLPVFLASSVLLSSHASAALTVAIGDFQPRFKLGTAGGNGSVDASGAVSAEGAYSISYSGTIADFGLGTNADNARPFIGIDQGAATVSNFAYIDNIVFTVDGNTIWSEDFSGATIGAISESNNSLAGTSVQSANGTKMEVIAAPVGFTSGVGNVALLSVVGNGFEAIRPDTSNVGFASVPNTTAYTMTFDLYIVPEPSVAVLGCFGVFGLLRRRR
jgi:hypothetical protein